MAKNNLKRLRCLSGATVLIPITTITATITIEVRLCKNESIWIESFVKYMDDVAA